MRLGADRPGRVRGEEPRPVGHAEHHPGPPHPTQTWAPLSIRTPGAARRGRTARYSGQRLHPEERHDGSDQRAPGEGAGHRHRATVVPPRGHQRSLPVRRPAEAGQVPRGAPRLHRSDLVVLHRHDRRPTARDRAGSRQVLGWEAHHARAGRSPPKGSARRKRRNHCRGSRCPARDHPQLPLGPAHGGGAGGHQSGRHRRGGRRDRDGIGRHPRATCPAQGQAVPGDDRRGGRDHGGQQHACSRSPRQPSLCRPSRARTRTWADYARPASRLAECTCPPYS